MSKLLLALCLMLSAFCFVPALSIAADDKAEAKEDAKADKEDAKADKEDAKADKEDAKADKEDAKADKEDAKEDDAPKKAPPKLVKEKEKKPKTTIEWTELTTKSGTLKKAAYKKGAKQPEPTRIEFTSESPAVRVKWTTKSPEGTRGGSIAMTLVKKKEGRGSEDKASYQRVDRLGNARGASEGSKTVAVGKGDFAIELEGEAIEYEITIEYPEKKTE